MTTELLELKQQKVKLESAYYELLSGERLAKGDVEGLGNAEFTDVSPKVLKQAIADLDIKIAKLEGKRTRFGGSPRLGGL